MHLEQGEDRHRLGQPVLVAEGGVEVDLASAGQQAAQDLEAPLQRDGRADVAGVDGRRRAQQVAEGRAEPVGVIGLAGGVEGDATQVGGQRRGAVEVGALGLEAGGELGAGVLVAAVLEHPRQQLVGGLLGPEIELGILGLRQHQPRLELEQSRDQDEELGGRLQLQLAGLLEAGDVGDDDLAELNLQQADLLAQHDCQEQVERPGEDVEVELEIGGAHGSRVGGAAVGNGPPGPYPPTVPDQLAAIREELRGYDEARLVGFIEQQAPHMPRTTLRYAIERLAPAERKRLMAI